ncbi:MAG: hypothetical protein MPJ78_06775 [Hyphomicrobiaceae bacterium]|nr:hypothetical protein [Hyphomicrobiaceae bacterium]
MNAPAPSPKKKNYPIPWIATYFLMALVLIAGSFVIVWYLGQFSSDFDYDDADVAFVEKIVLSPTPERGDFSALNGGDWQALCLVGWQATPKQAFKSAGIPEKAAEAMLRAYRTVAEQIKQSEFVLLYADRAGNVRAVRHPHGFAFAGEGAAACTGASNPVVSLPVGR